MKHQISIMINHERISMNAQLDRIPMNSFIVIRRKFFCLRDTLEKIPVIISREYRRPQLPVECRCRSSRKIIDGQFNWFLFNENWRYQVDWEQAERSKSSNWPAKIIEIRVSLVLLSNDELTLLSIYSWILPSTLTDQRI